MVKKVIIAVVLIFVFAGVLLLPTYFSSQAVDAQLAQQGKTIAELEFALQESKTTNNNIRKFIVKYITPNNTPKKHLCIIFRLY